MINKLPYRRLIKFVIVGGSGVIVNAGLLFLLKEIARIDYRISSLIAIECAIINNFWWNYLWTWRDRKVNKKRNISRRFVKFNLFSGATAYVVNFGLLVLLTEQFALYYQISNLIGILCGTGINFLVSHFWTFPRHTDEEE